VAAKEARSGRRVTSGASAIALVVNVRRLGPETQVGTFAVNSIPSAFMTDSVVFSVGLPFALNDR
jgi:hypothetical protein